MSRAARGEESWRGKATEDKSLAEERKFIEADDEREEEKEGEREGERDEKEGKRERGREEREGRRRKEDMGANKGFSKKFRFTFRIFRKVN
jgi:hypothetical protein